MIMNGANVNAKDKYGNTALTWATWPNTACNTETADLLRSYGAK